MAEQTKRIIVFIDSSNFYFHSKKLLKVNSLKLNWAGLIADIVEQCKQGVNENCQLIKAYYYAGIPDPRVDNTGYRKQKNFLNAISSISFVTVKTGYVLKNKKTGINVEKGVDTMLAVDMAIMAAKDMYDIALLISADGDFKYCIEQVKNCNKKVIICSPQESHSMALIQVCDKQIIANRDLISKYINNN